MPSDDFSSCLSTSPCSSTCFSKWCSLNSRCDHLQPKTRCRGRVHHVSHSHILQSSAIREKCILWGNNTQPLNEILETPYSFPLMQFQTLFERTIFQKILLTCLFCLLSQIQRLSVLAVSWFCVHIKTHGFFIPAKLQGNAYPINHFPQRNSVCSSGLWKESRYLTSRQCRLIKAGIFKLIYNKKHLALNI